MSEPPTRPDARELQSVVTLVGIRDLLGDPVPDDVIEYIESEKPGFKKFREEALKQRKEAFVDVMATKRLDDIVAEVNKSDVNGEPVPAYVIRYLDENGLHDFVEDRRKALLTVLEISAADAAGLVVRPETIDSVERILPGFTAARESKRRFAEMMLTKGLDEIIAEVVKSDVNGEPVPEEVINYLDMYNKKDFVERRRKALPHVLRISAADAAGVVVPQKTIVALERLLPGFTAARESKLARVRAATDAAPPLGEGRSTPPGPSVSNRYASSFDRDLPELRRYDGLLFAFA